MKFIFLDRERVPEAWLTKAAEITDKINSAPDENSRRAIVKRFSGEWGKLKKELLSMSHNKCWYTEANDCVGDWHVDHFRPKSQYRWLAFDWTNYRISGAVPNRTKSDSFLLAPGTPRATFDDRGVAESPVLLDPTCPGDADLITFDEEGVTKSSDPANEDQTRRVVYSAGVLGLDAENIITRRKEIWNDCARRLEAIRGLLADKSYTREGMAARAVKVLARDLKNAVDDRAPFSSVAEAYIKVNRAEWVLKIRD